MRVILSYLLAFYGILRLQNQFKRINNAKD